MNAISSPERHVGGGSDSRGLLYCDGKPRTSEKEWVALVRAIAAGETDAFGTLYMWTHGIVFTSISENHRQPHDR